ncbi:hypothetical protein HZA57_06430 [Candidatus Poribacteria bacterium]|nr:hypothetical protein [Candidatus Poribacteria bacterium]
MKPKIPELVREYEAARCRPLFPGAAEPSIEVPSHGRNSEIYIVHYPDGRGAVLRAYSDRKEFAAYRRALAYCAGRALPLPALLRADGGLLSRRKWGRSICIEQWVRGALLAECAIGQYERQAVLQSLAALHDVTSRKWGHLDRPRGTSYQRKLIGRARNMIAEIPADAPEITPPMRAAWAAWFADHCPPEPGCFSLIHQHLAPDDILAEADSGRAIFLDNGGLQFGHFAQDLEDVLAFLADSEDDRGQIAAEYAGMRKNPPGIAASEAGPYFRAEYHLKKLRSALKKQRKRADAGDARGHREALCRIVS